MSVKDRLIEEMQRLGYKTKTWSEAMNVSDKTQYTYENGTRLPKTEYWQHAAKLGMDIQYVITGIHSNSTFTEDEEPKSDSLLDTLEILHKQSQKHMAEIERAVRIANEIAKKTGV